MNLADPWGVLVHSLSVRPPPPLDEVRDQKYEETRNNRLDALREAKAIESARKIAGTEKTVLKLVKDHPGITFEELAQKMRITSAHTRVVTKRMKEDGRLRCEIGASGKKYWFDNSTHNRKG